MNQDSIFNLNNIPEVWGIATLSEIAKNERNAIKRGPFGSAIKKSFFVPTGYKVYEQKNVIYNDFKRGSYYISDEKFYELESFKVKAGDILMSCSGTVGKLSIVPFDFEKGIINQALLKITLNNNIIYTRFFFYLFGFNISRILQKNTRGSAMLNISSVRDLKNIQFPIPPLTEQQCIVAKIEELFTKLDAGVQDLKQAQALLKRYRQSVLKAAVEGRLTEGWREKHLPASPCSAQASKDELESAEKLLERILIERREKWQAQQLAKYKSNGKKPSKNWKDKYKEPTPPDTTNLPELPEGWAYATMNFISEVIHYGYTASSSSEIIGPKMLRITDIQKGKVNWDNVPYCKIDSEFKDKYLLKPGDLVFARTGATVGKSYLIENDVPGAVFASYLIRIILYKQIDKEFVYSFFQSPQYWLQIVKGKLGIGQPNVNATTLSKLVIPLPPLEEQKFIENEINRILSITDKMDSLIDSELKLSQALRQSILKRAFEGRLVPQNPNDKHASVLLDRIRPSKEEN